MILVDSNIPMYLVGAPHPHKNDAQRLLEHLVISGVKLVTDAEVFQEILHRYSSIRRLDAVDPAFRLLLEIADEVLPIERGDVLRAKEILLAPGGFSSRDAIHIAVMERWGIQRILSFDTGFDAWSGLRRIHALPLDPLDERGSWAKRTPKP